jgi:hypothetical protein
MAATSEFYLARAAECARDAENATLENVRKRCRRAEAAWLAMARRIEQGEALRASVAAEKARLAATSATAASPGMPQH